MMLSRRIVNISDIDIMPRETERPGLLEHIKKNGLTDRVWLKELPNGRYAIRDGRHRIDCCIEAGLTEIPALITKLN